MTNATRVWLAAGILALAACSSDEADAPKGELRLLARGGAATTGGGGSGGDVYVASYSGGDVAIMKDGALPKLPSFRWVKPSLGSNPRTITESTTLTPDAEEALLGDDGATRATGLHVGPGAVLTLEANVDWDVIAGNDTVSVALDDGVLVEGTIVTGPRNGLAADKATLRISATTIVVAATGVVDTSGADVEEGAGGTAGGLFLNAEGSVVGEGKLVARGGNGVTAGGDGAGVGLWAGWGYALHTGEIDASGGDASDGAGGNAGYAEVGVDEEGTAINAGPLRARGGDGSAGGGEGGMVSVYTTDRGPAYSRAELDVSGGNATAEGDGGAAGYVYVESYGGEAVVGGTIRATGGDGAGTGDGAEGGDLELYAWWTYGESAVVPARRVVLGAEADLSGGAGVNGGVGGDVWVEIDSDGASDVQPQVHLVGLASVDVSGGAGGTDGGDGGDFEVYAHPTSTDGFTAVRLASILNEVPVTARGGDATAPGGESGAGGYVALSAQGEWGRPEVSARALTVGNGATATVTNRAEVDVDGGSGVDAAGGGGVIALTASGDVRNEATLHANGGEAGTGNAGDGGWVGLQGDAAVVSEAALAADGGAPDSGAAGDGGSVWLQGERAACRDASATGGASATGAGGLGGEIGVASIEGVSAHGTLTVAAGAGIPAGEVGEVIVDGITVALTDGAVRR